MSSLTCGWSHSHRCGRVYLGALRIISVPLSADSINLATSLSRSQRTFGAIVFCCSGHGRRIMTLPVASHSRKVVYPNHVHWSGNLTGSTRMSYQTAVKERLTNYWEVYIPLCNSDSNVGVDPEGVLARGGYCLSSMWQKDSSEYILLQLWFSCVNLAILHNLAMLAC